MKSATIFISVGSRTKIYRSVEHVPPILRKKLVETTKGANSKTILIADRNGREEVKRAIQGLPSSVQFRLTAAAEAAPPPPKPAVENWAVQRRQWLEIAALGLLGLLIWLFFIYK
ncbi:MAG TPA: hypothetical protein VMZ52_13985 [Bryobacteraceae bacterium]|nr:hypothetical protein [Bryobacteraceae bacterium]